LHVEVYGAAHSPWVQAVLLGLHEQGIAYSLRSTPPWECLRKWGVLMPAVSIDGAPWQIESTEILATIGLEPISHQDLERVKAAWQGVLHRTNNPVHFFNAFSKAGDPSPLPLTRTVRNFWRSFIPLYMFVLITFAKLIVKPKEPDDFGEQYLSWERAIGSSDGHFFAGEKPNAVDILLFGVVQCHSSIPVPPLKPLIYDKRLPLLRRWISTMQNRYNKYPYLYSATHFASASSPPTSANLGQRAVFFAGLAFMMVLFPVTLSLTFLLMARVAR